MEIQELIPLNNNHNNNYHHHQSPHQSHVHIVNQHHQPNPQPQPQQQPNNQQQQPQQNHQQPQQTQQQQHNQVTPTTSQSNDVAEAAIRLLSNSTAKHEDFRDLLPLFSSPLKESKSFDSRIENQNLWLRLGLTYSLAKESPSSALQAFKECMRLNEDDPLPAMLAAKLMLEYLDDPEAGLQLAEESIKRCQKQTAGSDVNTPTTKHLKYLLSRSYLLASIMHAYIYEREPESIKQFKNDNIESSLNFLDQALETNSDDHLVYFHKALHNAKQKRAYQEALDDLHKAIKINPHHIPSMQLLILSLSALKHYDKALILCESFLNQHENNLLLLYLKCNLEQCLVETKGYKSALQTAQTLLKNNLKRRDFPSGELSGWFLVAEIFVKIGAIEDAERCVDEGLIHASGALSLQVMFARGLIAKARNNLIEAKTFFQSSLSLCPKHARALQQIGHVYYLLGSYSIAEKFLKDSIDVDPDCHRTWHYLSLIYIELGQHDKARECAKKSTVLEDTTPLVPISAISRLVFQ